MEFRILGPLEVRVDGERIALGGPKQRALLAILLLSANRVVSRDRLVEELWAGDPPGAARHAVEVNVSRLRKQLGTAGSALVTRAPGYLLQVAPEQLDLACFEQLAEDGRRAVAEGNMTEAARTLSAAEQLWRGRPLADLEFEPFARLEVERLEDLRLTVVEERIDAELALGRHHQLIPQLEALAGEDPLRERLRAQLMLALYRSGRQGDALETYRSARAALVEQVGVEPGPELRARQAAILRQDPALDAPRAAALPEELETASPLVGRERELAFLRDLWERARAGHGTVVVVSGPAGSGRTRLAAALAAEVHRQGAPVLFGLDGLTPAGRARRPTLLVLDDLDAPPTFRELGSTPVLIVAITDKPGLVPAAEHLA